MDNAVPLTQGEIESFRVVQVNPFMQRIYATLDKRAEEIARLTFERESFKEQLDDTHACLNEMREEYERRMAVVKQECDKAIRELQEAREDSARLDELEKMLSSGPSFQCDLPSLHIWAGFDGHRYIADEDTGGENYSGDGLTLRAALDKARGGCREEK